MFLASLIQVLIWSYHINCLRRARATSKIWRGSKTVGTSRRLQAAMEVWQEIWVGLTMGHTAWYTPLTFMMNMMIVTGFGWHIPYCQTTTIFVDGCPTSCSFLRQKSLEKSLWPTKASGDFGQDGHLWCQQGQPGPSFLGPLRPLLSLGSGTAKKRGRILDMRKTSRLAKINDN